MRLKAAGWISRGDDAGTDGGHVFILEDRPWHRLAHLHIVDSDGTQWRDYLRFRNLLQGNPRARQDYEDVKLELAERYRDDRKAYTNGKSEIIKRLLEQCT